MTILRCYQQVERTARIDEGIPGKRNEHWGRPLTGTGLRGENVYAMVEFLLKILLVHCCTYFRSHTCRSIFSRAFTRASNPSILHTDFQA